MDPHGLEHILDGRKDPTNLSLALLKNITDNFSKEREIGHGGFATVYKGVLPKRNVAVKRIKNVHTAHENLFYREVNSLLSINHPNIVRFLGFCASTDQTAIKIEGSREHIYAEIRERLLCFEFISNGNLQKHITDELRGLDWCTRFQIIKGICDGLYYLHMEKHILHMDLKPANILLDNDMVPKITDFGLSRLDEKSETTSLDRFGALGYCAPEYLYHGKMSVKSDIYSLGIIIIELVTGVKTTLDDNRNNVLRRWRHRWRKTGTESPLGYQQVTKCINIGLHCQEIDPSNRPFILEIVRDIHEMEDTNLQINNDNESTVGQISPYSEDDMLGIEPFELHFPFELNKELSCPLQLTNDTDSYIAFEIQKMSPLPYCTEPHEGIIPPHSKCGVDITLQPQDKAVQRANEFIVRSTKVNYGLTTEHITSAMFNKYTGNAVDEVNLDVVVYPEFYQDDPQESTIPSKSSIHGPSSGHAEASRSTHSNSYLSAIEPMAMTLQELHRITDGFSEKRLLGKGGFGTVYKGVFDNGEVIAVKKLHNKPGLVEDQFKNELLNLMAVKHQNIIRLVGYCSEAKQIVDEHKGEKHLFYREERALCLEYLQGGNLEELLSDESSEIDWEECYKIIKGICQGIKHLHTGSKDPIYHLDLKPANILLDRNRIPKIGDFGLSRLLPSTETFVTKTYSGTTGYMPPEYMHRRQVSSKFDVFSLGVIIIEIMAGPEGYYSYKCLMSHQEFINHVTENWSQRVQAKTMSTEELQEVQRCIKIALRCVEDNQAKRPTITEIVEELDMISQHALIDANAGEETALAALSI